MLIEERAGGLATAPAADLVALADELIAEHGEPTVVTPPEVALVAFDVREPIRAERFRAGDVLVTRAEAAFGDHEGWAMRMGDDRVATLAAAVCAAVGDHGLAGADRVDALCRATADARARARDAEWAEITSTVVQFEELDP